jgi:hypothetical protein
MSLDAVFTWVAFPGSKEGADQVLKYIASNRLREWMSREECAIVSLPRQTAHESHNHYIGWKLENMWPLAWVLGFHLEPTIEAAQIEGAVSDAILCDFLIGLDSKVDDLVNKTALRAVEDVIALEYRFYCAHNAVRNAQVGRTTVPPRFDPLTHGGVVHERRHSLTWCLSPGIAWDDTDLST